MSPVLKKLFVNASLLQLAMHRATATTWGSPENLSDQINIVQESSFGWIFDPKSFESDRFENRALEATSTRKNKKKRQGLSATKQCIEQVMEEATSRDFRTGLTEYNTEEDKVVGIRMLHNSRSKGERYSSDNSDTDTNLDWIISVLLRGEDEKRGEDILEDNVRSDEDRYHHAEENKLQENNYEVAKIIDELSNDRSRKLSEDVQRKINACYKKAKRKGGKGSKSKGKGKGQKGKGKAKGKGMSKSNGKGKSQGYYSLGKGKGKGKGCPECVDPSSSPSSSPSFRIEFNDPDPPTPRPSRPPTSQPTLQPTPRPSPPPTPRPSPRPSPPPTFMTTILLTIPPRPTPRPSPFPTVLTSYIPPSTSRPVGKGKGYDGKGIEESKGKGKGKGKGNKGKGSKGKGSKGKGSKAKGKRRARKDKNDLSKRRKREKNTAVENENINEARMLEEVDWISITTSASQFALDE